MKKACGSSFASKFKSLRQAKAEAARCLQCIDAPCSKACPAGTDPARFVRQVALDNPEGAAETILFNNVLGGTCGAVCPVSKLCEGACTRSKLDEPVRIGELQEFLHRFGIQNEGIIRSPPKLERNGQTVAVVGSGPAGLSTARELQRLGFEVTLYEARSEPGGALRYFLSPVRMDHAMVAEEVDRVRDLGVNIVCNHCVTDIHDLEKEFDHVVVSPGLQHGRKLANISGLSALEFLQSSNTDCVLAKTAAEGKRVVIVGGGSVAMDAAVTSKALGASSVTAVFVESLDEMRADIDEIRLAQKHHVVMMPERVVEGMSNNGVGLRTRHVSQDDEYDILHADTVIMAIGQDHDNNAKNLLNHEKVSYVGDAVNGGETVVQAVAEGKQAAERISMESTGRCFADLDKLRLKDEEALQIEFCGITFPNPFCLSSSPVSNTADMCARAFDAGWGGVVYKTLNVDKEQEILHPSPRLGAVHDRSGALRMGIGLQNVEQISDRRLSDNLADLAWLKEKYPSHVLGVSVMGFSESGWKTLVRAAADHGADWVELNFSCPQMRNEKAGHKVGQDVDLIERYTAAARSACPAIPLVAKMTPNLSDMVPAALAAQQGGANAVSAVNTFKSISHVNLDYTGNSSLHYRPEPNIEGFSSISGFSGPACRPMALRFIAEMAQDKRLTVPISGMGGIYSWRDAVEFLSLGASNLQVCTAVMHHGVHIIDDLKDGLLRHLQRLGNDSVSEIVGAGLPFLQPPEKLDLSTEAVSTIMPELCIGCGACVKSCRDGAVDAIQLIDGVARVDPEKCVGCSLCFHVCPVEGAVEISTRTRIKRPT